ncbi:MAG: hypothetical protein E6767_16375 [Dysgonomonas sp.]|nr:hypothetical protein [Dysgonomonas sp.]
MDGRELRKGNIVRRLVHLPIGYHTPTLPFAEITEVREEYVETSMGTDKYSEIAPIPLSMDILSRSGGTKHSEKCIIFNTEIASLPHLYVIQDSNEFYLSNSNEEKYSIPIEYLHHFQNIYFDLTGTELRIIL